MEKNQQIELQWLDKKPETAVGVTWGVPWKEGVLGRSESLTLTGEDGKKLPLQSWPAAYWPDGTVKWTTHAAGFDNNIVGNYRKNFIPDR